MYLLIGMAVLGAAGCFGTTLWALRRALRLERQLDLVQGDLEALERQISSTNAELATALQRGAAQDRALAGVMADLEIAQRRDVGQRAPSRRASGSV
jgi:hypothetical protein